jgi:hypothetical protein
LGVFFHLFRLNAITVITPKGGENWFAGSPHFIFWLNCVAEKVRIELWKEDADNSTICNSVWDPYIWAIPATTLAGNEYKVKVIGLTSTGNYDFDDNNFTISKGPFIIMTVPNGGELWIKGTTQIIRWV